MYMIYNYAEWEMIQCINFFFSYEISNSHSHVTTSILWFFWWNSGKKKVIWRFFISFIFLYFYNNSSIQTDIKLRSLMFYFFYINLKNAGILTRPKVNGLNAGCSIHTLKRRQKQQQHKHNKQWKILRRINISAYILNIYIR